MPAKADAYLAYVPVLGIEIFATRDDDLEREIPKQILAALERWRATGLLERLVWLERCRSIEIATVGYTVLLRPPKETAIKAKQEQTDEPKVLVKVADEWSRKPQPRAFALDGLVEQLAELLRAERPRSVLLVGPPGVGKTAAVRELVRRRRRVGLAYTAFWATSGSRLIAGMSGFGMWQERCQALVREAAKKKAVLHLGNLVELIDVGKCGTGAEGIAHFLRPHLVRGDLLAIAECTPEQVAVIEREEPHLLGAFQELRVEEPEVEQGKSIVLSAALAAATAGRAGLNLDAIETLDRLHRRYATYSVYPGRPLRFLDHLCRDHPAAKTLTATDVTRAFSRETGLPLFLLDDGEPLDLGETHEWFSQRVVGQGEAVDLVCGILATVKAGLNRPRRPIASMLFIGPTGVGKTEMAKALADFLYHSGNVDGHSGRFDRSSGESLNQSSERMVRFDMSEYADAPAVERLIGVFGSPGLLTARVREQPFAIVLFDEVEKAHAAFFDLLLQVLGEGRLTDAGGRLADFSNSVVIMTSNLGAESFQHGTVGFLGDAPADGGRAQAHEHFEKHVRQFLRPELYNRIDRIVPFAPLGAETLRGIARRELEQIARRDGVRFAGVTLSLHDGVADVLAGRGYEPRYGARPLRRAIERQLLAPLAAELNRYAGDTARAAEVRIEEGELRVAVRARLDRGGRQIGVASAAAVPSADVSSSTGAVERARSCGELRRSIQSLSRCPDVLDLANDVFRLERIEQRWQRLRKKRPQLAPPPEIAPLGGLRRLTDQLAALADRIAAIEDQLLLAVYGERASDTAQPAVGETPRLDAELAEASKNWDELLLAVYARRFFVTDRVLVVIYSEDRAALAELARAYRSLVDTRGARIECYRLVIHDRHRDPGDRDVIKLRAEHAGDERPPKETLLDAHRAPADELLAGTPPPGTIGMALALSGPMVLPLFEPERGLHVFKSNARTATCLVETGIERIAEHKPPEGIDRRGAIGNQPERRSYDLVQQTATDAALDERIVWAGRTFDELIAEAVEKRMWNAAREMFA